MIFLNLLLLLPIIMVFGLLGYPLFVVLGVGHIHAVLHPFVVFPAVDLAPIVLVSGIRACSGLPDILNLRAGGPVELPGTVTVVLVALLVGLPGIFLFLARSCLSTLAKATITLL